MHRRERLWRSLGSKCVYLHAFERGAGAKSSVGEWRAYDNAERPHSNTETLTPDEVHARKTEPMRMAA